MESDTRNIITISKLQEKLDTPHKENIIKRSKEESKEKKVEKKQKIIKLRIKRFFSKKRKKQKSNTNLDVNYSKSNFLSRLFFFWPSNVFKISNKGNLTHEEVCNVSKEQSIKNDIGNIKKTFLKYNSNKCKNYSLIITMFLSNFKLLFFLFILDLFNVGLDYLRMFFYQQIISIFSKSIFFPKREKFNF